MASTLATEKQADAIKQRMSEIRTELPYHADAARARATQLKARAMQMTDWKYHLSNHPLPILAAVVAVGYMVIPHKPAETREVVYREPSSAEAVSPPAKRSVVGGIVGVVTTLVLKQAASIAANQISSLLSKRASI